MFHNTDFEKGIILERISDEGYTKSHTKIKFQIDILCGRKEKGESMNYTEFVEMMESKVKEKLDAEVNVHTYEAIKNNGTTRVGLVIQSEHIPLSPTIYLEEFYRQFLRGEDITNLVFAIERLYHQIKLKNSFPFEEILDIQNIKKNIIYRLVNREANEELLKEVPFEPFFDLAILPYVLVDGFAMGAASMQIRKEHLGMWGITEQEILQLAKKNTPTLLPAEVGQLNEFMYIVTNCRRTWGAGTILYPELLDKIYQIIGENYYLLPSSVHEFVLIPESFGVDAENLKTIVSEINEVEVEAEEVLSDSVYFYSSVNRTLQMK